MKITRQNGEIAERPSDKKIGYIYSADGRAEGKMCFGEWIASQPQEGSCWQTGSSENDVIVIF